MNFLDTQLENIQGIEKQTQPIPKFWVLDTQSLGTQYIITLKYVSTCYERKWNKYNSRKGTYSMFYHKMEKEARDSI